MIRETGLEAGDAVYCERSYFKASSGNHSKFKTTLEFNNTAFWRICKYLITYVSRIFSSPRPRSENQEQKVHPRTGLMEET
jgi:hypothetical protein